MTEKSMPRQIYMRHNLLDIPVELTPKHLCTRFKCLSPFMTFQNRLHCQIELHECSVDQTRNGVFTCEKRHAG